MITTSTSQLIVTSAHYTAIAKALVWRIPNNEHIEVTLVSVTLSMCTFWKKSAAKSFMTPHFFAREIVDDCFQVSISKNLRLHATSLSLRLSSDFSVSTKWKAIFAVASFRNSYSQNLILRGVLTSVSCLTVLSTYSSTSQLIAWSSFARASNFLIFSPIMLFWPLVYSNIMTLFVESARKWILGSLWKEKAFLIAEMQKTFLTKDWELRFNHHKLMG